MDEVQSQRMPEALEGAFAAARAAAQPSATMRALVQAFEAAGRRAHQQCPLCGSAHGPTGCTGTCLVPVDRADATTSHAGSPSAGTDAAGPLAASTSATSEVLSSGPDALTAPPAPAWSAQPTMPAPAPVPAPALTVARLWPDVADDDPDRPITGGLMMARAADEARTSLLARRAAQPPRSAHGASGKRQPA